jgi:hypothetical protein
VLVGLTVMHACQDVSVTSVEVASVAVSPAQATLFVGDTTRLSAVPRDQSGATLQDRSVTWTSQDATVATVNASGLVEARGPGQTSITASSGGIQGTASVEVRDRPRILLSRETVELAGVAGEDQTVLTEVDVTSEGGATLSGLSAEVSYEGGAPDGWLSASLQSSQTPTALVIQASAAELQEGVYRAQVRISATEAGNAPQIAVEFNVADAPPVIELSTAAVGFVWEEGQPLPPSQSIQVSNVGGGQLTGVEVGVSYAQDDAAGWLSAELVGSVAPTTLTLGVDPTGLEIGIYDAFVDVESGVAANSPQTVRARLTVGEPPPELELLPDEVGWTVVEEDALPGSRQVEILNRGAGELGGLSASIEYLGGGAEGWLDLELGATQAPSSVTLSLTTTDLLPGSYRAELLVGSPDAVNSPQTARVLLEVLPRASAADSEISVRPDTLTADGTGTAQVTVILRDARGERIPFGGHEVTVSTTAGTLGEISDHGDGRYTTTLTAPTSVGTAVLTARVNGEEIPDEPVVEFVAGGPSTATSEVSVDPSTVVADGQDSATITVVLRDAQGNRVLDEHTVTLSLDGPGSLSDEVAVWDPDQASYSATATSTESGETTVSAAVDGEPLAQTAQIQFVPGAAVSLTLVSGDGQTGTVGEPVSDSLVVEVADALGHPVPGVSVTWDPGDGGSADPLSSLTGTDGLAATSWTLGPEVGEQTLTASAEGLDDTVTFAAMAETGGISASGSRVAADPDSGVVADGEDRSTVTVELRNAEGNPVGGLPPGHFEVALTVDGEESESADPTPVRETTTAGTYTFDVTNTAAEEITVTVTARGVTLNVQPTIQFVAGELVSLTLVSGNGQTGTIGEELEQPLVVEARDALGNPVIGVPVTWTPDEGDGSAAPPTSLTGLNGQASTTWTLGPDVGEQGLTASADGLANSVRFTANAQAGDVSASLSSVSADPDTDVTADGETASEVTVQLRDSEGNPIGGLGSGAFDVQLTDGQGGTTDAQPTAVTETTTDGTYTFAVTNTTAEDVTVIVTADGVTLDQQPTIQFVAGEAFTLAIESGDGQTGTVNQPLAASLVVQVTDAQTNPVPGVTITWDPGAHGSANPTTLDTDANGFASTSWTLGPDAGEQTLTASADGLTPVTFAADAQAGGVSASLSSVSADPDTDVTADGETPSEVTVQLRDSQGNPVGGLGSGAFSVQLTDGNGGSTEASATPVTETTPDGTYTFDVTNTTAEEVTVIVTADGTILDQQPTIRFVAGAPAALAFVQQPTNTEVNQPILPAVTVEIVDGFGNRVTDSTLEVTMEIGENPGESPGLGGTTQKPAVDGLATFDDLSIDEPGEGYTLIAGVDGLVPAESATFDVTPSP